MNTDQFARLTCHRKVQQVLANSASAVAAVPVFAKAVARYQQQQGGLNRAAYKNGVSSDGATLAKSAAGTALIGRLVEAANALYLFYKAEEPANPTEAARLHRRASDYTAMSDLALAIEAADLAQHVTSNKALLMSDYNLTAASIKDLTDDTRLFEAQLTAPQLAIDAAKIKGATAKSTLSALNDFLCDDLRAGTELPRDTHPKVHQVLCEASQVDDARRGRERKSVIKPVLTIIVLLLLAGSTLFGFHDVQAQTVLPYATPIKDVSLSIGYTLTLRKDYKKYVPAKAAVKKTASQPARPRTEAVPAELIDTKLLAAVIEKNDDIVLQTAVRADPASAFVLKLPQRVSGNHTLKFIYEENNPLLLQSINTTYTPMTAEVITATATAIGSALNIVADIAGLAEMKTDVSPKADSSVVVKVKFVTVYDLTPKFSGQSTSNRSAVTDNIALEPLLSGLTKAPNALKLPVLVVTVTPVTETFQGGQSAFGSSGKPTPNDMTLVYRNPAYYLIKIDVKDNGAVATQAVMFTSISLPQFGSYCLVDLGANFKGGKKTLALKLNNTTGGLAEYSFSRESVLSAVLTSSATGLDKIGAGINGLGNAETAKLEAQAKLWQAKANLIKAKKEADEVSNPTTTKPAE